MKNLRKSIILIIVMIVIVSCNKSDANSCVSCTIDGVEICEDEVNNIRIYRDGEAVGDLITLPSDLEFNDAAEQLCAELENEFGTSGNCYECSGPNVTDFPVCQDGDEIIVNGEIIEGFDGLSLETVISLLEENSTNEEVFIELVCQRN
ncbi:hypothetical protein [Maribacter sp. Asnod1-A12]|uniref:hypothetical protein n=1 Tax=Maribacter sp. Asnod1-A12 TaxID=3160576 RepID=UPI00386CF75D